MTGAVPHNRLRPQEGCVVEYHDPTTHAFYAARVVSVGSPGQWDSTLELQVFKKSGDTSGESLGSTVRYGTGPGEWTWGHG